MSDECKVSNTIRDEIKSFIKGRITELEKKSKGPVGPLAEAMIEEYTNVKDNLRYLNVCKASDTKVKEKRKRKPTSRNIWISKCMRKPENDGLGKDMKTCSDIYKDKGESLLDEYNLRDKPKKLAEESS